MLAIMLVCSDWEVLGRQAGLVTTGSNRTLTVRHHKPSTGQINIVNTAATFRY